MRMRRLKQAAPVLLALGALAGCGGSGGDGPDGDDGSKEAESVEIVRLPQTASGLVRARMPRERVLERLGGPPLLEQGPTDTFAGGCLFYAMREQPLANVWQFCFNDKDQLQLVLTAFSQAQPDPPEGASPVRAALIARADAVCQTQNGRLGPTTQAVATALQAYGAKPGNAVVQEEVDTQLGRFVRIIEDTAEQVGAFEAPDDAREAFDAYIDGLEKQAATLSDARAAFDQGDIDTYEQLGEEFTRIGVEAKRAAKEYGFTHCSASSFG